MEFISSRTIEINSTITEYDIKKANISLMRYYNLYPSEKLQALERLTKLQREVAVGLLQRDDKEFSKLLMKAFDDIVREFIFSNGLSEDDIISIKKDAVFVINHPIEKSKFGDSVEFVKKNTYQDYLRIPGYEFYFKANGNIDIKGINSDRFKKSTDGILNFVNEVMEFYKDNNNSTLCMYLADFVREYKKKELPFEYYRELNSQAEFRIIDGEYVITTDDMDESYIGQLDISYNYVNLVLPILRIFV